jgi:hypothetical protein
MHRDPTHLSVHFRSSIFLISQSSEFGTSRKLGPHCSEFGTMVPHHPWMGCYRSSMEGQIRASMKGQIRASMEGQIRASMEGQIRASMEGQIMAFMERQIRVSMEG